ncbi:MAG: T9SS type A sorting domain-containing protein [Saprospiraceae bacterium]
MKVLQMTLFFALSIFFLGTLQAQEWVSYQSQQQVNDLMDTGNDLLLATDAGLVMMNKDNLEQTIFSRANTTLTNDHIVAITEAPNGSSWIGTYDAILFQFNGGEFQDMTMPDHEAYDQFTKLYDFKIAPNGDFWVGTTDGVFHRQGQTWSHYDQTELGASFFEAWDIEINAAGEVLIASIDIHKFANGVWSNISETTDLEGYLDASLFRSSTGDLFVAGDLDQIGRFDGTQWQEYDIDFNGSEVVKFTEDVDGNIYFNTFRNGLFKLENGAFVPEVDVQTEAFDNKTPYFYIDQQNNRWMNSNIRLSVNKNGVIENTLIAPHTLESNSCKKIHQGLNGKMYFILWTQDNFSVVDADGNWSFLPKPPMAMEFELFNDILVLADDEIWVATGAGLYLYDGEEWNALALDACYSFAMDSQGKIYVRSAEKIYILEEETLSEYNTGNSSITDLFISGHGVDAADNLWIASGDFDEDNVIQKRASDGTWTTYTAADHPVINRGVGDFYFDLDGNVWVSDDQVGVLKFDGENWTNPIQENISELENYNAFSITGDADGKIYFAHQYGVTTLKDGVWGELLIENVPQVNSSVKSTIQFDDAGTLWWGSRVHGVFAYTPEMISATTSNFAATTKFAVYPNPAANHTTLDFTLENTAKVTALIYNQLGQLQLRLDLGELPAGAARQQFDLTKLENGFYAIQLQVNEKSVTKRIVVQR